MENSYSSFHQVVSQGGGHGLLAHYYGNSLIRALEQVYPEYHWQPWKFSKAPQRFWKDNRNEIEYFHWITQKLNISKLEDWYEISVKQVFCVGGTIYSSI